MDDDDPQRLIVPDFIVRFAALMHDVGKPATRRFQPGGAVTFYHHDAVGAKLTAKRMKALRFDKQTTKDVARLVELHLRFHGYGEAKWTDSAVRRYVRDAGDELDRLHVLTQIVADLSGAAAKAAASEGPTVLKMSHEELIDAELVEDASLESLQAAGRELVAGGVEAMLISRAGEPT